MTVRRRFLWVKLGWFDVKRVKETGLRGKRTLLHVTIREKGPILNEPEVYRVKGVKEFVFFSWGVRKVYRSVGSNYEDVSDVTYQTRNPLPCNRKKLVIRLCISHKYQTTNLFIRLID